MARKPKEDEPTAQEDQADSLEISEPAKEKVKPVSGFDPLKPYASVYGGQSPARYEQDGKFYTGDGREVDAP